jgi:hypothetical protein
VTTKEKLMSYIVELDFDFSCPLGEALEYIQKHKGNIKSFIPVGPAGGNPLLTLSFPTWEDAFSVLKAHYPDEGDAWLEDFIKSE